MEGSTMGKIIVIGLICLVFVGCTTNPTQEESSLTTVALKQEPSPIPSIQGQTAGIKSEPLSYEIIESEDQSHKALVKKLSDYTYQELVNLPIDKKMLYRVVVSSKTKENQVRAIVEKIIVDITTKDSDIDEITLFLYSDEELVNGMYDVATATWAPYGSLGNATPEIVQSNNRTSYEISIQVKENLEEYLQKRAQSEVRLGLAEAERRQIYKEVLAAEDRAWTEANKKYPVSGPTVWDLPKSELRNRINKGTDLATRLGDQYENELAKKYGLTREQLKEIMYEGIAETWPMPKLEIK